MSLCLPLLGRNARELQLRAGRVCLGSSFRGISSRSAVLFPPCDSRTLGWKVSRARVQIMWQPGGVGAGTRPASRVQPGAPLLSQRPPGVSMASSQCCYMVHPHWVSAVASGAHRATPPKALTGRCRLGVQPATQEFWGAFWFQTSISMFTPAVSGD